LGDPVNQHCEDVRADVRKSGTTLRALAKRSKLHVTSLSHCLRRPIPAANAVVASQLGKTLFELWPEWFDDQGNRKPRKNASRNREIAKRRNRQFAKGAV